MAISTCGMQMQAAGSLPGNLRGAAPWGIPRGCMSNSAKIGPSQDASAPPPGCYRDLGEFLIRVNRSHLEIHAGWGEYDHMGG